MSDFKKAFEWVIGNEGGFSNDANDSGGATNWGITHNELSRWRGHPVSVDDVKSLAIDEARSIYKKWYWDSLSADSIVNDGIAIALFDQAVNCGVGTAAKRIQMVLGVNQDGKIGPETLNEINRSGRGNKIIQGFAKASLEYYAGIVNRNHSQAGFILGWVRRGCKLLDLMQAT